VSLIQDFPMATKWLQWPILGTCHILIFSFIAKIGMWFLNDGSVNWTQKDLSTMVCKGIKERQKMPYENQIPYY
jgi:hypothetical protein